MSASGINKVILIGRLGADPEIRQTQGGTAVCTLSLATSKSWKDRQTGEPQERTEWHRCVFWNRLAEITAQYLEKGARIYVEGPLRTRKWTDQDGNEKYSTEVVLRPYKGELAMLDSRGGGAANDFSGGGYQENRAAASSGGGSQSFEPPADEMDDDIPF